MLKTRQLIAQANNVIDGSGWELDAPIAALGGVASGVNVPILALGPSNLAAVPGVSNDAFTGTPLAVATTTKGVGVLNQAIGVVSGAWVFFALAGAGASTFQLQLLSSGTPGFAAQSSNLTAATASNTMLQGWNSLPMTIPAERQAVVAGDLEPEVCQLFPGDIVQVATAGGVIIPVNTVLVLDLA